MHEFEDLGHILKKSIKGNTVRVDKSMVNLINLINERTSLETLGCCSGHNKYNMSVVVRATDGLVYELFSWAYIPRIKRFYRRDEEGYYYIPEAQ